MTATWTPKQGVTDEKGIQVTGELSAEQVTKIKAQQKAHREGQHIISRAEAAAKKAELDRIAAAPDLPRWKAIPWWEVPEIFWANEIDTPVGKVRYGIEYSAVGGVYGYCPDRNHSTHVLMNDVVYEFIGTGQE